MALVVTKFQAAAASLVILGISMAAVNANTQTTQSLSGQLHCYGDRFRKIIPQGERFTLQHTFSCPTCTGQTLVYGGVPGVNVSLSAGEIHVFRNGTLHQSLPLQGCSPSYLCQSGVNPERIWVQCQSTQPSFLPTYNLVERIDVNTWDITTKVIPNLDVTYANRSTNAIVVSGRLERSIDDFVIVMNSDIPAVTIQPSTTTDPVSHPLADLCDTLTTLHASEPFSEENYLQFVVDCVDTNGREKRWVITLDGVLENAVEPYQLEHTSGTVSVTPDGNHFLIRDMTQIIVVDRYRPNSIEPAVMNFSGLITGIAILTDKFLLIEVPGLNRILLDVTEFSNTTAERGVTVLPGSHAYCPSGVCPASVVVQDRYLVVFVKNESYLYALAYDLENTQSGPYVVDKIYYAGSLPLVCFFKEGDTQFLYVLPSPPPPQTPSQPPQTISQPTTMSQGTTESTSSGLDDGAKIGLIIGIATVIIITLLVLIAIIINCRKIKPNKDMMIFCQKEKSLPKFNSPAKSDEADHTFNLPKVVNTSRDATETVSEEDNSSGVETSSAESSRLSTPQPPMASDSDQQNRATRHLGMSNMLAHRMEQTSDFYSGSSRESTPSRTPAGTPLPPHHSIMQQDGEFSPSKSRMVVSQTGKMSSGLQIYATSSGSFTAQERSQSDGQLV